MQEFALYVDGAFSEIRRAETRPADKARSGVAWYPVKRIEGETPGEELVGDEHVITTARRVVTSGDVNAERNRRIFAGVPFDGKVYDFDQMGKDNITGAATLAKFAIAQGAQPGDLRWNGADVDFSWIAQDNTKVPMDAQTVSALGDAAAAWTQAHIFKARALKDMAEIPTDYTDDKYWP